ncbi:MAG: glycosyltransferase family 2 protein [Myxococcota bacterium]
MPSDSQAPGDPSIAVVIPCFRVKKWILGVLGRIGPEIHRIYVVDDHCPEGTADLVESSCTDPRVVVLRHERRKGVGGATLSGYRRALEDGAEILVKLDGDGQMDPEDVPRLALPVALGEADYSKGNRFYRLSDLASMPRARILGNSILSFLTKFSTGYWEVFDPTNGFTALHAAVARELPLDEIAEGYFFESDLLFRLNTIRAVVVEIPMPARYAEEESNLRIRDVAGVFLMRHLVNFGKRIFYTYYLRSFSLASIELILGLLLVSFGTTLGALHWIAGGIRGVVATSGTVMLAALPILIGVQLLLAFLGYDMRSQPSSPLHLKLPPPAPPSE